MKPTIAILLLLLLCNNAYSSDWVEIGGDEKVRVFVDKESLAKSGKYRKGWVISSYAEAQPMGGKYYLSSKSLEYVSCVERTSATLQIAYYAEQYGRGDGLGSRTTSLGKAEFAEVIPDSYGELILKIICRASFPSM